MSSPVQPQVPAQGKVIELWIRTDASGRIYASGGTKEIAEACDPYPDGHQTIVLRGILGE